MIKRGWLVVILLGACAHTPPAPASKILVCPAAGGPPWSELRSPHFHLRTDLPRERAREVVLDLEQRWARTGAAVDLILPSGPAPGETDVVVFARREDFAAIAPGIGGAFARNDDRGVPVIVAGPMGEEDPLPLAMVLQHELVHRFVWRRLSRLPPWLDEGMAEMLSSLVWRDGHVEIGAVPKGRGVKADLIDRIPHLPRLLSWEGFYATNWPYGYYAGGWALVHWLVTGTPAQREQMRAFGRDLAARRDAGDAFVERIGRPDALEPAFHDYLRKVAAGPVTVQRLPDAPPTAGPAISERTLDEAELHRLWMLVDFRGDVQLEDMRAHAGDSALLHAGLAAVAERQNDQVTADAELERAIALEPKEPRWRNQRTIVRAKRLLNAQASRGELAAFEPQLAAATRDSDDPRLLNEAAWYYGHAGKPAVGLALARRAVAARPENGDFLDTLALLLYQSGQRREALATQEEALARFPEGARVSSGMLERLALYRESAR